MFALQVGEIVSAIQAAGFSILALQSFHLDFGKAEEFLEVQPWTS